MKKWLISFMIISTIGFSIPSMKGTNGLINMPVATAVKYKEFDLGFHFQTTNSNAQDVLFYSNLGIFNGVELGFLGKNGQEGVLLNLKYDMLRDTSKYPLALGVGFTGLTSHTNTNVYMVLSKDFPNKLAGHFGFLSNINAQKINANVMFGLDLPLSDQMNFIADIIGADDTWNISGGLRFLYSEDITLQAFLEDIFNNNNAKFCFGATISNFLE
jgi:hypothetical protein